MTQTLPAVRFARLRMLIENGRARTIRTESQLSLTEVSTTIGVSSSTIFRWESGARRPRGDAALRYLDLLDELASLAA